MPRNVNLYQLKGPTRLFVALAIVIFSHPASAQLNAEKELPEALGKLAKSILHDTNGGPVKIGEFRQSGLKDTNAGPGIEFQLKEALQRESASSINDNAAFEISGDYGIAASKAAATLGEQVGRLKLRVIEVASLDEKTNYSIEIGSPKSVARLSQPTGTIPSSKELEQQGIAPDQIERKQLKAIASIVKKPPTVHTNGFQVCSSAKSPYGVSLEVQANLQEPLAPRKPVLDTDKAFVKLAKSEIYCIRLHNSSDEPVAASVSVDAIDVFHFSEERDKFGNPAYSHYIVDPKSEIVISGWFRCVKGPDNYFAFQVMGGGQGVASQIGLPKERQDSIGVVHVQFSNCRLSVPGENTKDGEETGQGPPLSVDVTPAVYVIDAPHDFVSIRYSKKNR